MATVVKCVTFLHASASPGFSSAKLLSSSSSFSSIPAQWRSPGFKGLKSRPSSTFGLVIRAERPKDYEPTNGGFPSVLAITNKLQAGLDRNKKEIGRIREAIESAMKDLSTVVLGLKNIEQELSAEPESELEPEPEPKPEHEPEPASKKRKIATRGDFLDD